MIPDSALPKGSLFLKATAFSEGTKLSFQITAPPTVSKIGNYNLTVVGIKDTKVKGILSLNKTNLESLVAVLGRDETAWTGASFDIMVSTARNPKSNSDVPAFKLLRSSIQRVTA